MSENLVTTIGLPTPTPVFTGPIITGFGFYLIADDGSVSSLGIFIGETGKRAFIGYPTGEFAGGGAPHGPLSLQYIAKTTTYTEDESGNVSFEGEQSGVVSVDCDPYIYTAPDESSYVVLLEFTVPGNDAPLPISGNRTAEVYWMATTSPTDGVGYWNLTRQANVPNVTYRPVPKFGQGYFPAFDMSGNWYGQLQFTSIISGVETTYTLDTCLTPVSTGFPSVEYAPQSGYKLVSQSETERVWQRPSALGGTDSITITLSSLIADPSNNSSSAEFALFFDFPQVFFYGNNTSFLANNIVVSFDYAADVYTYTYVGANFQALLLNSDGSTEVQNGSVPSGSDTPPAAPYTSGGTASPSYPGQILLVLGAFSNIVTASDFDTMLSVDLVADPTM